MTVLSLLVFNDHALEKMMHSFKPIPIPNLPDFLLEKGVLSQDQIHVILIEQQKSQKEFTTLLVDLGFVSEKVLSDLLMQAGSLETWDLSNTILDPSLITRLPRNVALKLKALPINIRDENLIVAMVNPFDILSLDQVRPYFPSITSLIPILCTEAALLNAIDLYHEQKLCLEELLKDLEKESSVLDEPSHATIRLINTLLLDAVKKRASDIHFEPEDVFVRIRYRIDGHLNQVMTFHRQFWSSLCVRLKIISNLNIAESRRPQNGRFSLRVNGREVDFRVSIHPTVHGENIVVRILDKVYSLLPLESLGYRSEDIYHLKKALQKPEGVIIITGPTGCGKTTTLYSLLSYISRPEINIMTLEQPVEYQLPWIRQTEILENCDIGFAEGVRSILRQDPDVILIGEIRDPDTAQMALRASMTGHQVYTTVHTNDALGVFPRLLDLGVEPGVLSTNLITVISQRLLRKLCPMCKNKLSLEPVAKKMLLRHFQKSLSYLFEPRGCQLCHYTGYHGRFAIAEILVIDEELGNLISEKCPTSELKQIAYTKGFIPLRQKAFDVLKEGITSLEEIQKVIVIDYVPQMKKL
jgi:type II secretory ATPase GspE/PulE/Tfp pilus assembly ATPase PilB-like protein